MSCARESSAAYRAMKKRAHRRATRFRADLHSVHGLRRQALPRIRCGTGRESAWRERRRGSFASIRRAIELARSMLGG
jgi:hypothetical protein